MAAPSPFDGGTTAYAITLGGAPMDASIQLLSIKVTQARGLAAVARIDLLDGDPATGGFALAGRPEFALGAALAVQLGYGETLTEVFSGRIVGQSVQGQTVAPGCLSIEASDGEAAVVASDASTPLPAPVLTLTWGQSILDLDLQMGPAGGIGGRVKFQGSALQAPGGAVTLAGVGSRFDGPIGVVGVCHRVAEGLWTTELDLEGPPRAAPP